VTLLLGIDTATVAVSGAIVDDGMVLGAFAFGAARQETELLLPALERLFAETEVSFANLDAVVVDIGPGRFTGVRVGIAAAKAIAFATGVPTLGCSSTEILLEDVRGRDAVAVVDLRRGEVAAMFSIDDPDGPVVRTTPVELGAMIADRGFTHALLVGDGAIEYRSEIASGAGSEIEVGGGSLSAPSAIAACRLVERTGRPLVGDPFALGASYLRGADVRVGWATRDSTATPASMEVE